MAELTNEYWQEDEEEIGNGGYGTVFLLSVGQHRLVRKRYELERDKYFTSDFINELSIYRLLKVASNDNSSSGNNSSITSFYGAAYDNESSSIWLEAMDCSLDDLTANTASRQSRLVLIPLLIDQISSALCSLHKLAIVHNDLTPTNILVRRLVDNGYHFKLVDVGYSGDLVRITAQGEIGGSATVRPPELLAGRAVDHQTYLKLDIWALGICCLYLANCYFPIRGGKDHDRLSKIWQHSSVYHDYETVNVFIEANRSGKVTGSLDVRHLLTPTSPTTSDGVSNAVVVSKDGIITDDLEVAVELITPLVTLNPDQRSSSNQVSSQVSNRQFDCGLPSSYDNSADVWFKLRRLSADINVLTFSYEVCLRLQQRGQNISDKVIVSVVYLIKRYLTDIDTPPYLYMVLSEAASTADFREMAISVIEAVAGIVYNPHCSRALQVNQVNQVNLITTAYYWPTANIITDWYMVGNQQHLNELKQQRITQLTQLSQSSQLRQLRVDHGYDNRSTAVSASSLMLLLLDVHYRVPVKMLNSPANPRITGSTVTDSAVADLAVAGLSERLLTSAISLLYQAVQRVTDIVASIITNKSSRLLVTSCLSVAYELVYGFNCETPADYNKRLAINFRTYNNVRGIHFELDLRDCNWRFTYLSLAVTLNNITVFDYFDCLDYTVRDQQATDGVSSNNFILKRLYDFLAVATLIADDKSVSSNIPPLQLAAACLQLAKIVTVDSVNYDVDRECNADIYQHFEAHQDVTITKLVADSLRWHLNHTATSLLLDQYSDLVRGSNLVKVVQVLG